jgi:hypothetical protein
MSKTLKQVAIDACNGADIETDDVWDKVASAVRKAVLEEAIEAVRGELRAVEDTVCLPAYRDGFADAFKALTRLMGDE